MSEATNKATSQDDEFIELVTRLNDAARICAEQVVREAAGYGENRSIFLRAVISRLKDAT